MSEIGTHNRGMLTTSKRNADRMERWMQLETNFVEAQVPDDMKQYIVQSIEGYGTEKLATARIGELYPIAARKMSAETKYLTKGLVTIVSAMTFSLAPGLIAGQAGRGPLAFSAGLFGGALAGFVTHDRATRMCTGLRLKAMSANAKSAIHRSMNDLLD
jgi:hypothetical protein